MPPQLSPEEARQELARRQRERGEQAPTRRLGGYTAPQSAASNVVDMASAGQTLPPATQEDIDAQETLGGLQQRQTERYANRLVMPGGAFTAPGYEALSDPNVRERVASGETWNTLMADMGLRSGEGLSGASGAPFPMSDVLGGAADLVRGGVRSVVYGNDEDNALVQRGANRIGDAASDWWNDSDNELSRPYRMGGPRTLFNVDPDAEQPIRGYIPGFATATTFGPWDWSDEAFRGVDFENARMAARSNNGDGDQAFDASRLNRNLDEGAINAGNAALNLAFGAGDAEFLASTPAAMRSAARLGAEAPQSAVRSAPRAFADDISSEPLPPIREPSPGPRGDVQPEGVYMFAGQRARTADRAALERAQTMEASGASRDDIWRETGWFKGVDGQWRFEIDDSGSRMNRDVYNAIKSPERGYQGTFSGALTHDDLWEAYPDLGNERVVVNAARLPGGGRERIGNNGPVWTHIEGPSLPHQRSTGLHEAQHGIQDTEGFSRGGSPRDELGDELNAIHAEREQIAEEMRRLEGVRFGYPESERGPFDAQLAELQRRSDALHDQLLETFNAQHGVYRRIAGEVEARNVQRRANLTPEERRARPPWETQDVPDDQQIVRRDNNGVSEMRWPPWEPRRRLGQAESEPLPATDGLDAGSSRTGYSGERQAYLDQLREQGFDVDRPLYHGTRGSFDAFDPGQGDVYLTDNPRFAEEYTISMSPGYAGNIRPVFARNLIEDGPGEFRARPEDVAPQFGTATPRPDGSPSAPRLGEDWAGELSAPQTQRIEGPDGYIEYTVEPDGWHIRDIQAPDEAKQALFMRLMDEAQANGAQVLAGNRHAPGSRRLGEMGSAPSSEADGVFARGSGRPAEMPPPADRVARRLGQAEPADYQAPVNPEQQRIESEPGTERDFLEALPTEPERWREAIGLHPWIDRPHRAQMVIMASARDAAGRRLFSTDEILNATGIESADSLKAQLSQARRAGVPLDRRPSGPGGATRTPGGETLNNIVRLMEEAERNGQYYTAAQIGERLGISAKNVEAARSHIRNGSAAQRALPPDLVERFNTLDAAQRARRPDERGRPLRRTDLPTTVYHATTNDVQGPLRGGGGLGDGAYASPDPSIDDWFIKDEQGNYLEGSNIVPERVPDLNRYARFDEVQQRLIDLAMRRGVDPENADALIALQAEVRKGLQKDGYVGIYDPHYAGGMGEVVTFDASNRRAPWARMSQRNRGSSDPLAGVAALGGAGLLGYSLLPDDAQAQEGEEDSVGELSDVDMTGAEKIRGHNLERDERIGAGVIRHTSVWRLRDGRFVVRVQDQDESTTDYQGTHFYEMPPLEGGEPARLGPPPPEAPLPSQGIDTSSLHEERKPTTPLWAFALPLAGGYLGGRFGRAEGLRLAEGRPIAGEVLGSLAGGSAGGVAAGAMTDAEDVGGLTGLGAELGGLGRLGYRGAEMGVRRAGEAIGNVRGMYAQRLGRSAPLPYVDIPASEQRARLGGSLDEEDLAREMRGGAIEQGRQRLAGRESPVTMEERIALPDDARGSLANRLTVLGADPLRELARQSGVAAEGTVRDLSRRLADAARRDPTLIDKWRATFTTLGVGGIGLALFSDDATAAAGDFLGDESSLPDWADEAAIGVGATAAAIGGRFAAPSLLERIPQSARLGQMSRVSELPFHEPAAPLLARRGARVGIESDVDPRLVAAGTAAAAFPLAWGTSEVLDPLTESPQETEAHYNDYLGYAELRNQAMRMHLNGVRSWEVRDSDPELAAELQRIERDGGTEQGRRLNQAHEENFPAYP